MIETLRRNPIVGALALACAVLAAIVVVELATGGTDPNRAAARKAAPPEQKLLPPIAALSIDQAYPETVNRPLWIPTRRPAPPAVAASGSIERGKYVLLGVTIAGETKIGLLKEKASGRIHRAELGRQMNGLQVTEVQPERVTLALGTETEVIELNVQRPAGAQGAAPGHPAPPPAPGQQAAQSAGPFAPAPPASAATAAPPASPLAGHVPGTPVPVPSGPPLQPRTQQVSPGPLSPGESAAAAAAAAAANPSSPSVPQPQSSAPMTPEELLARRRARRNQTP